MSLQNEEKVHLSKEKRSEMTSLIKAYFLEERGEEIGDLGANLLLDFIIDKISAEFYNKGVEDSYAYLNDQLVDLLEIKK